MHEKEKDLVDAFMRGQVSRRGLIRGLGAMGVSAATAGVLVNLAATRAMAAGFDWKKHKGKTVKLLLNKHPYTDAMIKDLENFKALTGMDVKYDVFPEDVYFDKVTAALSSKSTAYDVFMTGAYMTWTYGPAGWIEDLNKWIKDPAKTAASYNWDDFLPGVRNSCAWNGKPGAKLGSADAKQWCLPWAFEQYNLSYNKTVFDKAGLKVPTNMDELVATAEAAKKAIPGGYGIGVRGSRSWATIHPGFLSGYANYGQKDLNVDANGKLSAAMNTDVSKQYHAKFVEMVQKAGSPTWSNDTWYQVGTDLGAGKSAMIYDADILGYFQQSSSKESGHLAFAPFAANPDAKAPTPNIWIWSLSMSSFSQQKDPAWYFLQWATGTDHDLFGARKMDLVDPARKAVWDDATFQKKINNGYPGYMHSYEVSAPGASIKFTPQPLFFDVTTDWAAMLQKMVAKEVPVDEGLDQLAKGIDKKLKDAGLA